MRTKFADIRIENIRATYGEDVTLETKDLVLEALVALREQNALSTTDHLSTAKWVLLTQAIDDLLGGR